MENCHAVIAEFGMWWGSTKPEKTSFCAISLSLGLRISGFKIGFAFAGCCWKRDRLKERLFRMNKRRTFCWMRRSFLICMEPPIRMFKVFLGKQLHFGPPLKTPLSNSFQKRCDRWREPGARPDIRPPTAARAGIAHMPLLVNAPQSRLTDCFAGAIFRLCNGSQKGIIGTHKTY